MITILVAYDDDRVIGCNGSIPWYFPEDLKMFKHRTLGQCVIMGRKTWESLPKKPLSDRLNIVVSNTMLADPAARLLNRYSRRKKVFTTLNEAVAYGEERCYEVFIIGGAQIYREALNQGLVDRVIASEVKGKHEGDTFFPELDPSWKEVSREFYDGFDVVQFSRNESQASMAC